MVQSCRIFPSMWTGKVQYCSSRCHGCVDLSASAKTRCLLPLLLLPGRESALQAAVCLMRLSISSSEGDGGGWRRFLTWWWRTGRKKQQHGGRRMLRPGSSPESLCFLSLVCYCVAARYMMCVCVCVCVCGHKQFTYESGFDWYVFVKAKIPMCLVSRANSHFFFFCRSP